MKIDINKKYRTKDGRQVVIHTVNGPDRLSPVVASVENSGTWMAGKWSHEGRGMHEGSNLVEIREPREWNVLVYDGNGNVVGQGESPVDCKASLIRVREILD